METTMTVTIYDLDANDIEQLRCTCQLDECFPDDQDEREAAAWELQRCGRYWAGGGAAPAVLLTLASR